PATSGFIAEFLCFYGAWLKFPVLALLSVFGIVLTAIYVLRMLQKIFLGPFQEATYPHLSDARTTEWVAISALAVLLLIVGIYPRPLVDLIPTGFKALPGMEQILPSSPALLPGREKGAKHLRAAFQVSRTSQANDRNTRERLLSPLPSEPASGKGRGDGGEGL